MAQNILKLIVKAVKERRNIAIRYRGQQEIRILEPHAVYTDERGEVVVDGFQVRGYSASGRPAPFWRPFRLKKITAISVLKESFVLREQEGFSQNKQRYTKGLIAIAEKRALTYMYSAEALQQMGPFPQARRSYRI